MGSLLSQLESQGFAIIPEGLETGAIHDLIAAVERATEAGPARRERSSRLYAMRNLFELVPEVRELARSEMVRRWVDPVLGPEAPAVRGLLFDKTPVANWKVAWHQDRSVAVRRRMEVSGFGPWSDKAGVPHVQPPREVLEKMLIVRIHLDECDEENGPLKVAPGSHALGILPPDAVAKLCGREPVICRASAGGILLMRPLLLHASSTARKPGHRRVIHLEFCTALLPGGLEWFEAVSR